MTFSSNYGKSFQENNSLFSLQLQGFYSVLKNTLHLEQPNKSS